MSQRERLYEPISPCRASGGEGRAENECRFRWSRHHENQQEKKSIPKLRNGHARTQLLALVEPEGKTSRYSTYGSFSLCI